MLRDRLSSTMVERRNLQATSSTTRIIGVIGGLACVLVGWLTVQYAQRQFLSGIAVFHLIVPVVIGKNSIAIFRGLFLNGEGSSWFHKMNGYLIWPVSIALVIGLAYALVQIRRRAFQLVSEEKRGVVFLFSSLPIGRIILQDVMAAFTDGDFQEYGFDPRFIDHDKGQREFQSWRVSKQFFNGALKKRAFTDLPGNMPERQD